MGNPGRLLWGLTAFLTGLVVPGCAALPSGPLTSPTVASPSRVPTPAPAVRCVPFLPGSPCGSFASVGGTAGGEDLAWAATGAVVVKLESVGGQTMLTIRTPCNPLSAQANISGNVLEVHDLAVGTMGCPGERSGQEATVRKLLERSITLKYDGGRLSWSNETGTLVFAPQP